MDKRMLFRKRKQKILVADGDGDFVSVVTAVLEHAGYTVDTAENGADAHKAIRKERYDLLVLGTEMPGIDGIRLLHMARKSARYASVPILLVGKRENGECFAAGNREGVGQADGLVRKPIKTRIFLENVKTLIERNGG